MGAEKTLPLKLDDNLAKDLISGVQNALSTMFGVQASLLDVSYSANASVVADISGIVGMVQDKSEAVLALSFKKDTICYIVGKMYKREFKTIDKAVKDAIGEISNIVYGAVKKSLNSRGYFFKPAIPNIIHGEDHTISNVFTNRYNGQIIVLSFRTDGGDFFVQISVAPESAEH